MKKRRIIFWVCTLLLLCAIGVSIYAQHNYLRSIKDAQENAYVLNASIIPGDGSLIDEGVIHFSVQNNSYCPTEFREILLLSAYDTSGKPMQIDGTSYTPSSVSLVAQDGQTVTKMLSAHQVVYGSEFSLEKGKPSGAELFDASWSSESVHDVHYLLQTTSNSGYETCILRLDVILLGKPVDYPYADWECLDTKMEILQNGGAAEVAATIATKPVQIPNSENTNAYTWELYGGKALLVNAQDLQVAQLAVPATICLSKTETGWVEDPIFGDAYEVMVASNAFYGHSQLQTLTFAEGVSIERDRMCATNGQGMFQNCSALQKVENIPDTVVSVKNAFAGCSAMQITPELPSSVEDMTQCFWRCAELKEVTMLPQCVVTMNSSFRECAALTTVPKLPEGVQDISQCFYKCSSLEEIGRIPDSVTDMSGSFGFCSGLSKIESFPVSLKKLSFCFQGCSNLKTVADIPEGVEDLSGSFYNCIGLSEAPQIPDSVSNMDSTFYGCTGIVRFDRWPASLKNLNSCFAGCTNLQTVPMIPRRVMEPAFFPHRLRDAFMGCTSLSDVQIESCSNFVEAGEISDHARVSFSLQHVQNGLCESCQIANGSFKADDLTIRVTELESFMLEAITEFLENDVPECLMDSCSSMTFTSNFAQFAYPLSEAGGIAWWPGGEVHIRVEDYGGILNEWKLKNEEEVIGASEEIMGFLKGTIYHELGHCYDSNYSSYPRFSASSEWRNLVEQEGDWFISKIKDSVLYTPSDYPRECFAMAVSRYYRNPEELMKYCPGMYEYIDDLLRDKPC